METAPPLSPERLDAMKIFRYSWNVFRFCGDYLHMFGIIVLVLTVLGNKSVAGFSRNTQILYLLVFCTRYLDLATTHSTYLVVLKLTYIVSSIMMLALFHWYGSTYVRRNDTCRLVVIIFPCVAAAMILTREYSMLEVLWTFSQFLEGFAMVPQYIFCYQEGGNREWGAVFYVICMGTYRVFYALNWIYKKVQMPHYSDVQSWIGGLFHILLFFDFLLYRFRGNSILQTMVLRVDKITEIREGTAPCSADVEVGDEGSAAAVSNFSPGDLELQV